MLSSTSAWEGLVIRGLRLPRLSRGDDAQIALIRLRNVGAKFSSSDCGGENSRQSIPAVLCPAAPSFANMFTMCKVVSTDASMAGNPISGAFDFGEAVLTAASHLLASSSASEFFTKTLIDVTFVSTVDAVAAAPQALVTRSQKPSDRCRVIWARASMWAV